MTVNDFGKSFSSLDIQEDFFVDGPKIIIIFNFVKKFGNIVHNLSIKLFASYPPKVTMRSYFFLRLFLFGIKFR